MNIILAKPRGFCAGVERAIDIVERSLEHYGAPVYVRHEIVHNAYVVESLQAKGAIFVEEVDEIPDGAITIFSAHGVSEKVESEAKLRSLPLLDATCPLVSKVHKEAQKYEQEGRDIIMIGHEGHPEVEGTCGRVKVPVHLVGSIADAQKVTPHQPEHLGYVTQTTLSVDDTSAIISVLKQRFPHIVGPDLRNICYATQNRQNAVRHLAKVTDLILVIGATNSSNSNRLRDLSEECGTSSYLISDASDISPDWLANANNIGITAGASAPEILVASAISFLQKYADEHNLPCNITNLEGIHEDVHFKLPADLLRKAPNMSENSLLKAKI